MLFLIKYVGLALAYLAAAKIGLIFGTVSNSATIFWPPGGIALAAVILGGIRYLPAVFVGAYLSAVMVDAPLVFAIGSSIGNALETFLGFILVSRFYKVDLSLTRTNDFFGLIAFGAAIPAIASATFGPLTLMASGLIEPSVLTDIMWRWWRADVLGIVFFTPLILLFAKQRSLIPKKTQHFQEWLAIWVCAIAAGQIVLLGWRPLGLTFEQPPQLVWLFGLIIWAGLRTGRRNTVLIQFMFLAQALISAYSHTGYFMDEITQYGLANFWMFAMFLATGGTSIAILGTSQRLSAESIKHQAQFDFLTNLPNRPLFYDRFGQLLAMAKRHGNKFSVIFIDLDKFKPVNDTLGHHMGDLVLVSVANRLTSLVREVDTVARLGGDEFAILVSDVGTSDDVVTLAEKVLSALNQPFHIKDQSIEISGSIGIALYPDHGKDMDAILNRADQAMYQAKKIGGACIVASNVSENAQPQVAEAAG